MWQPDRADVDAHLARIGSRHRGGRSVDDLADLQLAHLLHVPFENLDIHLGVDIVLDPEAIHDKVVAGRRGGYCYELNSVFGALLGALGFEVEMVSARVTHRDGELGPEFDHMALVVATHDEAVPFLVDVGFGDAFTEPIPLVDGAVRADRDRDVRVCRIGDRRWTYDERRDGAAWATQYVVTTAPQPLPAFSEMNEWQQRSPDSHFRRQPVCSLLTPTGRITISGDRLIETVDGERHERDVTPDERTSILRDRFGVVLARPL